MEGVIHRQDFELPFAQPILVGVSTRKLEGRFNGFRTAVAEEDFLQSAEFDQFFCQQGLVGVIKEIADVNALLDLFAENIGDSGMVIPQRIHGDAR